MANTSAHTDTQQQVAAARHLLRAGGLGHWAIIETSEVLL
jgi:hypothetical protein